MSAAMKIESIIIDREHRVASYLKECLHGKFPDIVVKGEAVDYTAACRLMKTCQPDLVFSDVETLIRLSGPQHSDEGNHFQAICMSDSYEDAVRAIRQDVCGFMLKPLSVDDIVISVGSALRRISERPVVHGVEEPATMPHTRLIGIPTMEGIDFLHAHEIIRCEGLQKCTRIVSTRKTTMISAYNIGEFRKLLGALGFFACHKSHLINLMHVRKFTREGFIHLSDNSSIPLARRKKLEFLRQLRHL